MYLHATTADTKFAINEIYQVEVLASISSADVSTTISVYPLNDDLSPSLALAKSDVLTLPILPDPFGSGNMVPPDTTVALGGTPTSSAPLSAPILSN